MTKRDVQNNMEESYIITDEEVSGMRGSCIEHYEKITGF